MIATATLGESHRDRILEQARKCVRKGRFVVPVLSGKKAPKIKDWPNLRLKEDDLPQFFGKDDNIGLILGEPSGDLCDIDLRLSRNRDASEVLSSPYRTPSRTRRSGTVAQDDHSIERQTRFRTIPINEFIDGMTISTLRIRGSKDVQDCGFGVFKIEQAQDGFGTSAYASGRWSVLHDRWPPCHRSMIRVVS